MTRQARITCVGCPMGCEVTLTIGDKGEVTGITGNACKEGKKYVMEEYESPVRVLTATVLTVNSSRPLLSVRTDKAIPKIRLTEGMCVLVRVRAKPRLRAGDIIVANLLGTGSNVVATSDLLS